MDETKRAVIDALRDNVNTVADLANKLGLLTGKRLVDVMDIVKTIAQFERSLRQAVLYLWRGDEGDLQFIDRMTTAIDTQYRKAWYEGMREIGLDPTRDMRPEWEEKLNERIWEEYDYIVGFAIDIMDASANNKPIDPLYTRVDLWVNRYNEVKELAKIVTGADKRLVWQLGATELHCTTCAALNGIVAFASVWEASKWRPQSSELACGGFHCDCRLSVTNAAPSRTQPGDVTRDG